MEPASRSTERAGVSVVRALPYGLGRTRLAPLLIPVVFHLIVGSAVVSGLVAIGAALWFSWWLGLLALVTVPAAVVGMIMIARIGAELTHAVLRMADDLDGIATRLPRLESTMDDVAHDMPPLGFLRLGATGRQR